MTAMATNTNANPTTARIIVFRPCHPRRRFDINPIAYSTQMAIVPTSLGSSYENSRNTRGNQKRPITIATLNVPKPNTSALRLIVSSVSRFGKRL